MDTYDRQQAIQDRLRTLQNDGRIDELSVKAWGKQIPVQEGGSADPGTRSWAQLYDEFKSWADRSDCSLEPAFSRHNIESFVADDRQEVIRLPIICLAAYDDDGLLDLAPRSAANRVYTVDDFVAALEANERDLAEREPVAPVESN